MKTKNRQEHILSLLNEYQFLTVAELSRYCKVSEMTIRRDLESLNSASLVQRTYGGAVPVRDDPSGDEKAAPVQIAPNGSVSLLDRVDVVVATSVQPYYDELLVDQALKKNIPIIAESCELPRQETVVAVDNYQAAFELGKAVGRKLCACGESRAIVLDLTFPQTNTQLRSRGFIDGLSQELPSEVVLSINSQSRYATALQLARDALLVYPAINVIFAINDITARGAIEACRELRLDPARIQVVAFGLEGDTLKNELMTQTYCQTVLAMFPEIVSRVCILAAVAAFNHIPLSPKNVTPYAVLDIHNLSNCYEHDWQGWRLKWDAVSERLKIPTPLNRPDIPRGLRLPRAIGLVVPFTEHEWYRNLTTFLQAAAQEKGMELVVIDAEQNARAEVELRRQKIAALAAATVKPGDVILIDSGPLSRYLAEQIINMQEITVVTNSIEVLNILRDRPNITPMLTGGAIRPHSPALVGPLAESALSKLQVDKLFLMVSGILLEAGLSHNNLEEAVIKQAMIRASREVILLADHTCYGAKVGTLVAPFEAVHKLVTDDALSPGIRLGISNAGISVVMAHI